MSSTMVSSSRQRSDMATIFDVFCEVGAPDETGVPMILTKYPGDYNDEAVLNSVRQFSFPCKMKELDSESVQQFSFVLTDAQSRFSFGYCQYSPRTNTCICFLSGFSWPVVFYKMLDHISLIMNDAPQTDIAAFLTQIYHTDVPNSCDRLTFESTAGIPELEVDIPEVSKLPTLREDQFMLEFYNAVSHKHMMTIYASLLKERRIIFTGRNISQLSSSIYAASTLLYPMFWQSVLIPVLPEQLVDMLMTPMPMPFLIGVHKEVLQNSGLNELGDVVIVDLEEKTIMTAHDDIGVIPPKVLSHLKSTLKTSSDMGDSMARCFLRANVMLFGGYRLGFVRNETNGEITWDKELFIREQRPTCQTYLRSLFGADGVQYLERFVDEKLSSLNRGDPISDEFEREIIAMEGNVKSQVVKGKASGVLGALKVKVTGTQIGAKLKKLTSFKNWSLKKRTKIGTVVEPMQSENVQMQDQISKTESSIRMTSFPPKPTEPEDFLSLTPSLVDILCYLDEEDIPHCKLVNRRFCDIIRRHAKSFPIVRANLQLLFTNSEKSGKTLTCRIMVGSDSWKCTLSKKKPMVLERCSDQLMSDALRNCYNLRTIFGILLRRYFFKRVSIVYQRTPNMSWEEHEQEDDCALFGEVFQASLLRDSAVDMNGVPLTSLRKICPELECSKLSISNVDNVERELFSILQSRARRVDVNTSSTASAALPVILDIIKKWESRDVRINILQMSFSGRGRSESKEICDNLMSTSWFDSKCLLLDDFECDWKFKRPADSKYIHMIYSLFVNERIDLLELC